MSSLTINHFFPFSTIDEDPYSANKYNYISKQYDGKKVNVIDSSTGDKYVNDERNTIRLKCTMLLFSVPIMHGFIALLDIVIRLMKCLSFYHFWKIKKGRVSTISIPQPGLSVRAYSFVLDLVHIILAPICLICMELSALYGLFLPNNGRKLYNNFERLQYGEAILANCFQPINCKTKINALGGEEDKLDGSSCLIETLKLCF